MNETLTCSVVDIPYRPLSQKMSDEWNGDWFTADLGSYAAFSTDPGGESRTQAAPSTRMDAGLSGRYQYEYGQSFGGQQRSNIPMRPLGAVEYTTGQQASIQSSPRFSSTASGGVAGMSMNHSQSSTPAAGAFAPILPSQKLHTKPASSSASAYTPHQAKRGPPDADNQEVIRSPKRRPSRISASLPSQVATDNPRHALDLSEEERLLVQLKQDQNLPWKEIAKEFENKFGRPFQVPALQMRYKRLRERLRPWKKEDIAALEAAHEYWENNKFEIIANKMLDFGVQERWPARNCERRWEQLHPEGSKSDIGPVIAERAKSQQSLPMRFDTDLENHSIEWSIPSPPRETSASQATSPVSGLALTQATTLPTNPFLQDNNFSRRQRYDPT